MHDDFKSFHTTITQFLDRWSRRTGSPIACSSGRKPSRPFFGSWWRGSNDFQEKNGGKMVGKCKLNWKPWKTSEAMGNSTEQLVPIGTAKHFSEKRLRRQQWGCGDRPGFVEWRWPEEGEISIYEDTTCCFISFPSYGFHMIHLKHPQTNISKCENKRLVLHISSTHRVS